MIEIYKPDAISRFKKQRFLLDMSEERFRDEVVRPLFLRQGFSDGRDLCGPFERGKDAFFVSTDRLGIEDVYVLQIQKGNINLSRNVLENLLAAIKQLQIAAQTKVTLIKSRKKQLPAKIILCVSGKINNTAQEHISKEVNDPRLLFLDSDELIPKIDELFPELWLGIGADIAPYFRKIKEIIEISDDTLAMVELLPRESQVGVATDRGFVMLQLYRMTLKLKKQSGQVIKVPHFEQLPITGLLNRKRARLLVIFGSAGAGKSTSLKRLAYLLAAKGLKFQSSDKPVIPILLRAADLASNISRSLVELCDAETRRITGLSTGSFTTEDLTAGRVYIFIDALDELPEDKERLSVLSLIQKFHVNYPDSTVVVTSRDYNAVKSLPALKAFEAYNLSPIDYRQAQQIIKTLQKGRNLPVEKSQEIFRRLEEVHGMELNPLLVTVFAATSEYSRQDIPANITELFKKFTEMMLGRWDAAKGFKHQYHAPLKDFILTKVAFQMHKEKVTSIKIGQFDHILTTELANRGYVADTPQLRDELLTRSGLFIIVDGTIEFRHLMMQEFFAGRGIPSMEFLNSVIADQWWRRAVIFYFGEHPDDSKALRSAIDALQGRSVEENYNSALTLGLALQACYLVEIKDKIDIYRWVIDGMANAKDEFLAAGASEGRSPISWFLAYYLFGRDSVALSVLETRVQDILGKWNADELSQDDKDIRTFWIIIGLIECGAINDVEPLLKKFKPSDPRLLLGIHLGCYLIQHVRVSTKQQSDSAEKICDNLNGRINHLRTKLLDEMKTELLEVRGGAIKTIDARSASGEKDKNEQERTD
jgi:NACHT domain